MYYKHERKYWQALIHAEQWCSLGFRELHFFQLKAYYWACMELLAEDGAAFAGLQPSGCG